jgi:hypothetical protein
MTDTKSILASRTVWANLIGLASIVLGIFGFDTQGVDTGSLVDAMVQIVAATSFVASTVFRITAKKQIGT